MKEMMQNYVLGFAFSPSLKHVVMIKKNGNSVPAHAGLFNGVGGKRHEGESIAVAMCREFQEETGVFIPYQDWTHKGFFFGKGYVVEVCTTRSEDIYQARTMETEQVCVLPVGMLLHPEQSYFDLCPHAPTLIQLCLNPMVKNFTFEDPS